MILSVFEQKQKFFKTVCSEVLSFRTSSGFTSLGFMTQNMEEVIEPYPVLDFAEFHIVVNLNR